MQTALITLGVQVYEMLRPKFPHIIEIIQQIPDINVADIQKLDEKIALGAATKGNKIDKAKKDLFKKLTAPVKFEIHKKQCKIKLIIVFFFFFHRLVDGPKFMSAIPTRSENCQFATDEYATAK